MKKGHFFSLLFLFLFLFLGLDWFCFCFFVVVVVVVFRRNHGVWPERIVVETWICVEI